MAGDVTPARYVVRQEIGRGTGGVVWLAQDRTTGEAVALKTAAPGAPEAAVLRLLREHAVLARVRHPHLVRALGLVAPEAVETPPGSAPLAGPVLVLEHVSGPSLAAASLPRDAALRAWSQVAHALDALHAHGFVHRDMKPENVLLRGGGEVAAVLTDLGTSLLVDDGAAHVAGTLDYLAPETLAGLPPRPSADVYGLGALLYRLLLGRPPWSELSVEDSLRERRRGAPPPPPGADLPPALARVLSALLAPHPEARPGDVLGAVRLLNREMGTTFPDAPGQIAARPGLAPWIGRADVLRRVEDVLASVPETGAGLVVHVHGETGSGRTRLLEEVALRARMRGLRVLRDGPAAAGVVVLVDGSDAGAAGTTAVATGAPGTWFVATDEGAAAPRRDAIDVPLGPLSAAECLALTAALVGLPPVEGGDAELLRSASGGLPGAVEQLVAGLAAERALTVDSGALRIGAGARALHASAAAKVGERAGRLSPRAAALLERLAAVATPLPTTVVARLYGLEPASAECADLLDELAAGGLVQVGGEAKSGETWAVAEPIRSAVLLGLPQPRRVMVSLSAASVLRRHGAGPPGEVARLLEAGGAAQHAAPFHRQAGLELLEAQSPRRALPHLARAVDLAPPAERPALLVARAQAEAATGDAAAALRTIEQALPGLGDAGQRARALALAAEAASHAGDPVAAEAACRRARRLFRGVGSLAGRAECTSRLGVIAADRGELRRARAAFRAALRVALEVSDRALEARVRNNLGDTLRRLGDLEAAAAEHAAARDVRRALHDARGAAKATNNLGIVLGELRRLAEAAAAFSEARAAFRECGDRREEARCLNNRAMVLWRDLRLADADEELAAAVAAFRELGDAGLVADALANRGLVAWDRGELARARQLLAEAAAARRDGEPVARARVLVDLGDLLRACGDLEAAHAAHGEAATLLTGAGGAAWRAVAAASCAVDLRLLGAATAPPVPPTPKDTGPDWSEDVRLRLALEAARAAELDGRGDTALQLARDAVELARRSGTPHDRLEAAMLVAGASPPAEGVAALEAALERLPAGVHPEPQGRARIRLAAGLVGQGRLAAAATELEAAGILLARLAESLDAPRRAAFLGARDREQALAAVQERLRAAEETARTAMPAPPPAAAGVRDVAPMLLDVVRLLNANLVVEELLPRVVDFAVQVSGAERGCLMLFDERPDLVRVARNRQGEDLPTDGFQHSQTIVEKVRSSGRAVVVDSFAADAGVPRSASIHELRLGSATCVPLPAPPGVSGGILGAVYVDSPSRQHGFGEREVEALGAIATHAAIAIVNAQLLARVRAEKESLEGEVERLRGGASASEAFGAALGRSPAMREVFAMLLRVAGSDVSVLIEGESGTGKEVVARAVHAASRRATGPFVPVDCGGLPESLIESELFGHRRGAFTGADRDRPGLFEQASGGTIFLDEVAGTSPALQAKLLRVLQEREVRRIGENEPRPVDVRVIAASNKPLASEVAAGKFREDLFYRLNVVGVRLPPLRERPEDVPLLARHFLERAASREGRRLDGLTPAAAQLLARHPWPGNVRELQNVVERAAVVAAGPEVGADDLPPSVIGRGPGVVAPTEAAPLAAPSGQRDLWGAIVDRKQDFWAAVRDAYARHEVTRTEIRALVSQGLLRTGGSYRAMTRVFGIRDDDYKRFMDFLRQNACRIDFRPYRAARKRA